MARAYKRCSGSHFTWWDRDMKRLYTRAPNGKGYVPIGWICLSNHVLLDCQPELLRAPAEPSPL
jgi:hypothetical protein